jgi:hypothetical protein
MAFSSLGVVQLKSYMTDGSPLTPRQRGLLFAIIAFLALLPIIYLNSTPQFTEQKWTEGETTLYFAANNNRVLFPNQCLNVTWNVEGIKTIHINEQGKIGTGTAIICNTSRPLIMQVELLDGSKKSLQIPVQKLYQDPLIALLLLTGVVSLALSAYNFLGTPVALAILTVALTLPTLLYFVVSDGLKLDANDYAGHLRLIQAILDGSGKLLPHFLYQITTLGLVSIFPQISLKDATLLVLLGTNILTCIGIYLIFRLLIEARPNTNWKWTLVYLAIPLILFIGPINFNEPFSILSAYVYPNPPHSPTQIFLKPFAVMLFAGFIALSGTIHKRWLLIVGMAILTIAAAFAKPSYTLPFMLAVGLVFVWSFVRPLPIKRWELIAAVLLPAFLILVWQYLFTYARQEANLYGEAGAIKFAPFALYVEYWKVPAAALIPQFLISLVFPIAVYGMYWRQAWRDLSLNTAWLTFFAGQAMAYVLIESPNFDHGNMVWSGRITSLVLFAVSIAFFLCQNREALNKHVGFPRDWRFYLGAALLILHIAPNVIDLL